MTREMEAYWETKKRIERKLLMGVWALLLVVWTAACSESATGPYTQFEVATPPTAPAEPQARDNDEFRCGEIQVSHGVCEKGLGPEDVDAVAQ